jgi:hypothetical protein
MPRYSNTNAEDVTLGGSRIKAKGTWDTEVFFPVLPAGVTADNTIQLTDIVKLSQLVQGSSGDTTVAVPAALTSDFTVVVSCTAGLAYIYLNATTKTPKVLGAGLSWTIKCKSRTVDSVIVSLQASGTVIVVDIFSTM